MERHLRQLPEGILELVFRGRDTACALGVKAYLIGGFVRDLIAGVKNYDLDIVVEGDGIAFAEKFGQQTGWRMVRHKRFRTATLLTKEHHKVDIATARSEYYPQPASLPVVTPGSLDDDVKRRDFTINTMAISLDAHGFGKLIDLYHGKKDLAQGRVRILHDRSFIDDPTRVLRAIRFEQRMGFNIEPHTLQLLRAAAKLSMVESVQPHRIRDEIVLMLKEASPLRQIRRVDELLGFGFISKKIALTRASYAFLSAIERQLDWFRDAFGTHRKIDGWLVYFMGLVDGMEDESVDQVLERFAFHKGESKRIRSYCRQRRQVDKSLNAQKLAASAVSRVLEPLSYEVIVACRARTPSEKVKKHIADFLGRPQGVKVWVNGHDLKEMGVPPGPRYKALMEQLRNAVIDGKVRGRQEELDFVRRIIG